MKEKVKTFLSEGPALSIGNLSCLHILYLHNNQISSLPSSLGDLSLLEELYVNANNLELLPDAIVNCKCLKKLNVSKNKLQRLPPALDSLPLEKLDVTGNPSSYKGRNESSDIKKALF